MHALVANADEKPKTEKHGPIPATRDIPIIFLTAKTDEVAV
jgi:hypothetical protein